MKHSIFAFLWLVIALASPAFAQPSGWEAIVVARPPSGLFAEACRRGNSQLPDGCTVQGTGAVSAAWYEGPTGRYAHAILGDAIEAGSLAVRHSDGTVLRLELPDDQVFEDRFPRIADLDQDGSPEIITIRSSTRLGGSVAVYGISNGRIEERAASAFIGRPNRWLNIAAIADFLGNGRLQVAFVETPHIGGTLKLAEYRNGSVRIVARARGFSNHQIGSRAMALSAVSDFNGDGRLDLAVPNATRDALRIVSFTSTGVQTHAEIALPGPVTRPFTLRNEVGGQVLYLGLRGGQVVAIGAQAR